jgi:hypothetical protein
MEQQRSNGTSRERHLDAVIAGYLETVDAGEPAAPQEWLAHFPELAPQLGRYFADQRRIENLLAEVKPASWQKADHCLPVDGARPTEDQEAGRSSASAVSCFGDYELLGEIARGGMGVVCKARQRSLNRTVALKMILSGRLASAADVRRFRSEAEAAAQLDHPHIVPIYEIGQQDGQYYFTMKLIDGGNLAQHTARFSLDPRAAASLVAKVAAAVHHAHQRGVLHRDLKPANIVLDAQGEPHLTDFGLARRMQGPLGLTGSGVAVGTPSYMAPEQALGPSSVVTTAADVYSLGAILCELLTGRPPFRAETPLQTLRQALERGPEQPRALNPRVHRDLQTICLKCLEREPAGRYPSALDLRGDLERFLRGEAVLARAAGPLGRCWRWFRRSPVVAGLGVALFLSLLLGASVASWQWWKASNHARLAEQERARAADAFRQAHRAVNDFCARVNDARLQGAPGQQVLRRDPLEPGAAGGGADRGTPSIGAAPKRLCRRTSDRPLPPIPHSGVGRRRGDGAKKGHLEEAARVLLERRKLWTDNPTELYEVARELSRLAALAERGAPKQVASNKYADLAMEVIQDAMTAGFQDGTRLRQDPVLAILRKRVDFPPLSDSRGGSPPQPQRLLK